jgi:hypothetical protein
MPPRQRGTKRSYNPGMRAWRLLIVLITYVAFDLADPSMPGAFSLEVEDSPVDEAVHANRLRQDKTAMAVQPAIPERRIEPRNDSFTGQRLPVTAQLLTKWTPLHPAPRSALLAPAPSLDDH